MITYNHMPHREKTPRANLSFQENKEFPMDSQLTDVAGAHSDDSKCVHTP